MLVYCLHDRKMREFGQLVLSKNDEAIRRSVVDGIRGSKSVVDLHPTDFDVMCVGHFDQDVGLLSGTLPRLVVNVGDLMEVGDGER